MLIFFTLFNDKPKILYRFVRFFQAQKIELLNLGKRLVCRNQNIRNNSKTMDFRQTESWQHPLYQLLSI